jgi:hypothetical protein
VFRLRFFVLLRERLFFLVIRLRPPFILIPLPLPLTPWRMYVRIAGVGEFTTKQYPINGIVIIPQLCIYLSVQWRMSSSVSFVSCYIDIYESGCDPDATQGWRMFHFMEVARTGVPMIVYVCSATKGLLSVWRRRRWVMCVIEVDVSRMFCMVS